ncbi:hypothetical protein GPECTOR_62g912 [Gonium pectorale]|uniref:Uncharacterized protein n=1 Tax=Gonium pectorale TaxID=33097 RepID=A0A150G4L6_GONPE|nr:hypothetical protein GPECTOR_62g912 [Gonium pectorale]|eukprot:KXZ44797.1 hypothetical protein GPECTOR_62g912 [Gonium pectorale]
MCGFLGCLGHAFKRQSSTTSSGAGEHQPGSQPHPWPAAGERPHHHHAADRQHGRGGRGSSHNGQASSTSSSPPSEQEGRAGSSGTGYGSAPTLLQPQRYDIDLAGGTLPPALPSAAAAAAAAAAATQPAMLLKLDRGAATSRRTALHVAAERGQLHVLSSIIEGLCCSATAGMLAEAEGSRGGGRRPGGERGGSGGGVEASGAGGGSPDARLDGGAGAASGGEETPTRAGARGGGAPMAPEQYIQYHLNMQDSEGTTALSLACRFGHVDCCRLLLANGSARTLSDARGNTPLHYAALRGHLGVLFMLLDEFVEPGQEDELAGYVDARNHAGCTPLHYAVWGRQSGSVQVLLQHGADVLPRNSRPAQELTPAVLVTGSTPLHLAAARGHAERVLEPLQLTEDDPQPATLASLDPRVQLNANGHMPYQVAQRLGFYPLAMLLRPSIPILRLFSDEERAVRFYGPAPLRALAAEALNKKLLAELDALAAATPPSAAAGLTAAAAPPPAAERPMSVRRAAAAAAATTAAQPSAATTASGGAAADGDSDMSSRRHLSAPATLDQLQDGQGSGDVAAAAAGAADGATPWAAAANAEVEPGRAAAAEADGADSASSSPLGIHTPGPLVGVGGPLSASAHRRRAYVGDCGVDADAAA